MTVFEKFKETILNMSAREICLNVGHYFIFNVMGTSCSEDDIEHCENYVNCWECAENYLNQGDNLDMFKKKLQEMTANKASEDGLCCRDICHILKISPSCCDCPGYMEDSFSCVIPFMLDVNYEDLVEKEIKKEKQEKKEKERKRKEKEKNMKENELIIMEEMKDNTMELLKTIVNNKGIVDRISKENIGDVKDVIREIKYNILKTKIENAKRGDVINTTQSETMMCRVLYFRHTKWFDNNVGTKEEVRTYEFYCKELDKTIKKTYFKTFFIKK